jgi:hypothetical protein
LDRRKRQGDFAGIRERLTLISIFIFGFYYVPCSVAEPEAATKASFSLNAAGIGIDQNADAKKHMGFGSQVPSFLFLDNASAISGKYFVGATDQCVVKLLRIWDTRIVSDLLIHPKHRSCASYFDDFGWGVTYVVSDESNPWALPRAQFRSGHVKAPHDEFRSVSRVKFLAS